ncbi:hypothetical protein NQZ68_038131 [Dissostichus eleginoides]|nr:hypothetical protein NQZ68_038131 [Dissostichus eleginoides]
MSDSEWMSRLRKFASTGAWPAGEGNRPAPRQKKWFELYQRIEKCPMQAHGQKSLFGQVRQCTCGFHPQKVPWDSRVLHLVRSTDLWDSRVLHLVRSTDLWDSRVLHLVRSTDLWDSRVLHLVRSAELRGSRVQQVLSKALWDTSRLQQKDTCEHH